MLSLFAEALKRHIIEYDGCLHSYSTPIHAMSFPCTVFSALAGGILQILRSDWFRDRAVFSFPPEGIRCVTSRQLHHLLRCNFS